MFTGNTDVFVAGGGPAGLAAAIAAAQRGLSVAVADWARPPIDKACGEGIMPDGLLALRNLGIDLATLGAVPFEGIRFVDAAGETHARFPQGIGFGMRRADLHRVLVEKAESLGIHLAWGTRVEAIRQGEAIVAGQPIRARYIVCADGQNSALRPMAGLNTGKVYRRRYGFRNHYRLRRWSPFVEVHWADCGQMYVTPVGVEDLCVVFISSDKHVRLEDALPAFPELHRRLAGQPLSGKTAGGVSVTRKLNTVVAGNIALLGDSSGSADAITGDGLSLVFQQATALADAMLAGDLAAYQATHRRISRMPRNMGELMLVMDDHPWIRRRIFRGFTQSPRMFGKLLAMHTQTISPLQLGVNDCLSFGWSILRA